MTGMFKGPAMPATPAVTPPPVMPDPVSPAALAAKRDAMQKANQGGRTSTMLTTPLAAGGGYSGTKTGG